MNTFLETASALHAEHMRHAEDALACSPPRMDLFDLHTGICLYLFSLLESRGAISETSSQLTEGAESPSKTEG